MDVNVPTAYNGVIWRHHHYDSFFHAKDVLYGNLQLPCHCSCECHDSDMLRQQTAKFVSVLYEKCHPLERSLYALSQQNHHFKHMPYHFLTRAVRFI